MNSIICKECGKEIPQNSKICPNCGIKIVSSNPQKSKTILCIITATLIGILLFSLGIFIGMKISQPNANHNSNDVAIASNELESNTMHLGNREQPLEKGQSISFSCYDYQIEGNRDMTVTVKNSTSSYVDLEISLNSATKNAPASFYKYDEDSWSMDYLSNPFYVYFTDSPASWTTDYNEVYPAQDISIGVNETKTLRFPRSNGKYIVIYSNVLQADYPNAIDYDSVDYSGNGTKFLNYYYFLAIE